MSVSIIMPKCFHQWKRGSMSVSIIMPKCFHQWKRGSMSVSIIMPKCFHQWKRGRLLDNWLSLMSTNIGLMYLEKYPKLFPYGVSLSMALIGICFEEIYKKPLSMVKDPLVE
jgi:hypothetical protein